MKKSVLLLLLILFLIWLYRREKKNSVPQAKETTLTSETKVVYVSSETIPSTPNSYKEFAFVGLTDQTFVHNLDRLVHATAIVGGEEVDVRVIYPDLNSVRIQSNSPITGTLIIH